MIIQGEDQRQRRWLKFQSNSERHGWDVIGHCLAKQIKNKPDVSSNPVQCRAKHVPPLVAVEVREVHEVLCRREDTLTSQRDSVRPIRAKKRARSKELVEDEGMDTCF